MKNKKEESEFGILNDGWDNEGDLSELETFFEESAELAYEIRNCRRGTVVKGLTNVKDLIRKLKELRIELKNVIEYLKTNK